MSIRTMARVWEESQHSGTNLLMLLAVADFSDDDGIAYPSVDKLAKKCRMSKRNAQDRLRELSDSGELVVLKNQGPPPKFPNLFRINLSALGVKPTAPVQPTSPVQCSVDRGAVQRSEGVKPTAPKPSVNNQEPSTRSRANTGVTLKAFLDQCKRDEQSPIREDDPIFAYAEKVGIDDEMLEVCWAEFKARYLPTDKRQKDWRDHYRNAVRRNWYGLWFIKHGESAQWTTAGEQARRAAA